MVHYHNNDFALQSHMLEAKEFPDSHSGANIVSEMDISLQEWTRLPKNRLTEFTRNNKQICITSSKTLSRMLLPLSGTSFTT